MANDVQQGSVIGKEAVTTLGAKKVAIIDDKTAYGAGLAEETEKAVKAAGGTIVAHEFTNDKATDFKAILTKIKAKNPDIIMYGGMDAQGGPMVKQMKELGMKAKYIAGDGVCSAEWPKLAAAPPKASTARKLVFRPRTWPTPRTSSRASPRSTARFRSTRRIRTTRP